MRIKNKEGGEEGGARGVSEQNVIPPSPPNKMNLWCTLLFGTLSLIHVEAHFCNIVTKKIYNNKNYSQVQKVACFT